VREDVLDGKVTAERAARVYGVVVDADSGAIDDQATANRRESHEDNR
jgi:N-methylhydantoinase B/oxoprolinase/acetone carboxylase alpha subunit